METFTIQISKNIKVNKIRITIDGKKQQISG